MPDTTTANLGLTLPTVGADDNAWGGILNADLTALDALWAGIGDTAFGTAATQTVGASGGTVPLLNGTNTWSGVQNFTAIQTTGNVGVGVTAAQRLDVGQESRFAVDVATSALKVTLKALTFDGTGGEAIETDATEHAWLIASAPKMTLDGGGNLNVAGALSKGSGSFRIPHPLPDKSDTHWLVHSFIEGPRADLIYRGRAPLENGIAVVDMDIAAGMSEGTFAALCRDPQVWVQNETGWAPVRGVVKGAALIIEAREDAADTVSWMVVAERQDPTIKASALCDADGRVIVEPLRAKGA